MLYTDSELLPLSALQHLIFCERQCALIHTEQAWTENMYTAQGRALHERTHSQTGEKRKGRHIERGMPLRSLALGIAGMADVVEFDQSGVPYPVEYKRGKPKVKNMDEIQLCAQAICLEEMLGLEISDGAIFYGKTRRRKTIKLTAELRTQTKDAAIRLRTLLESGITPPPEYTDKCKRCSLLEMCRPKLFSSNRDVEQYVNRMLSKPIGEEEKKPE